MGHNLPPPSCMLCKFGSAVFGHGLTKLMHKKWDRITIDQILPYLSGLHLKIVGGLSYRGYSEHDIDVVGDERDVRMLVERLEQAHIGNLVHYCGADAINHSHLKILANGFLVTFFGNRIYYKNPPS